MPLKYKNQDPPILESKDGGVLAEWLGRELRSITNVLERMDGSILSLLALSLENFVATGYGGLALEIPTASPASVPTGDNWITVPFDAGSVSTPRNVVQNPTNDTLAVTTLGVYFLTFTFNASVVEAQQGRTCEARFYNVTDSTVFGESFIVGVGRNSSTLNSNVGVLLEATESNLNKEIRLELGNASAAIVIDYTPPNTNGWDLAEWTIFNVSEYRGEFDIDA